MGKRVCRPMVTNGGNVSGAMTICLSTQLLLTRHRWASSLRVIILSSSIATSRLCCSFDWSYCPKNREHKISSVMHAAPTSLCGVDFFDELVDLISRVQPCRLKGVVVECLSCQGQITGFLEQGGGKAAAQIVNT